MFFHGIKIIFCSQRLCFSNKKVEARHLLSRIGKLVRSHRQSLQKMTGAFLFWEECTPDS